MVILFYKIIGYFEKVVFGFLFCNNCLKCFKLSFGVVFNS